MEAYLDSKAAEPFDSAACNQQRANDHESRSIGKYYATTGATMSPVE